MVRARRFIVTAALLAVAALLAGLLSAGPAGAGGRLAVWQVAVSLNCNNPSFCGAELGGLRGRETFYSDNTADAQLTQGRHLVGGGPAAGAQHISVEATGWFIAPSSQNPAVNDFWIASEVVTFTGRQGGPPVTVVNPFPPYPEDTGIPAAPGHYNTSSFLGFRPPPGVTFQVQVVKLPNR
jgi:hypothetical protein